MKIQKVGPKAKRPKKNQKNTPTHPMTMPQAAGKKPRKDELVSRPDPTHVEREGNDVGEAGDPLIERFLKVVLGYLGQQGLQGGVVGKRHQQNLSVGSAKDLVEKLAKSL